MARIKKNLKKRTIVLIAFSFAVLSFLTLIIFHNFQENHNFENLFLNFDKSIISFSLIEIIVVFLLTAILVVLLSYVLIKSDTLERIVNLDELTKVLTRRSFFFDNADGKRKRDGIILLMDIDYFKSINDTFGHDIGDYYLQKIGKELKKIVKNNLYVGRLGGEEFALFFDLKDVIKFPEKTLDQNINFFLNKIHTDINNIYLDTKNSIIKRTCSIGVSKLLVNDKISDALSYCDKALQSVKQNNRNNFKYADDGFIIKYKNSNEIITMNELDEAVSSGNITYYFQPVVNIKNNSIEYFEALLRWTKNDGSIILPKKFLSKMVHLNARSLAKNTRIWRNVFEYSFKNLNIDKKIKISINVHLSHFANIGAGKIMMEELAYIKTLIDNEIIIEITEDYTDRLNYDLAYHELQYLRDNGIEIALDDYGAKSSNLDRLINLPWSIIKLDKQMIDRVTNDKRARVAVEGIKSIAENLNNEIIAEGVENKEQLAFLKKININLIQGFLFSKPMPGNEVEGYIKKFSIVSN